MIVQHMHFISFCLKCESEWCKWNCPHWCPNPCCGLVISLHFCILRVHCSHEDFDFLPSYLNKQALRFVTMAPLTTNYHRAMPREASQQKLVMVRRPKGGQSGFNRESLMVSIKNNCLKFDDTERKGQCHAHHVLNSTINCHPHPSHSH